MAWCSRSISMVAVTPCSKISPTPSMGHIQMAGLVLSGITLYGTTAGGGSYGYGAVFEINTDGTGFDLLYSFSIAVWSGSNQTNADGAWPQAGLVLSGTTLFGTTAGGGTGGWSRIQGQHRR